MYPKISSVHFVTWQPEPAVGSLRLFNESTSPGDVLSSRGTQSVPAASPVDDLNESYTFRPPAGR